MVPASFRLPVMLCLVLLGNACAKDDSGAPPDTFVAAGADFAGFRSWNRFEAIGDPRIPLVGPTYVYARDLPPGGLRRFPVGTVLVKATEVGSLDEWDVHAMVKRDGTFNPMGTVGWEFFQLDLSPDGAPEIVWRGEGPPSGFGYGATDAATVELTCNDCHAAAWTNDGVLTPQLHLDP